MRKVGLDIIIIPVIQIIRHADVRGGKPAASRVIFSLGLGAGGNGISFGAVSSLTDWVALTIAGTPLASDVSLYIAEDTTGQLYCIDNQILNEDGTVSTAIELEEGDQVKVWGYASRYLELQEGLKIVVVQPGIIERNGELVILDENLKVD